MKIELKNLTKQYLYGAKVLSNLNFTVSDGEIVALLGNEGDGKTTLLKVIAGIENATSGEVLFDGEKKPMKSDDVIMLFDDGALFKRWNVFDNLAYSLKIRGVDRLKITEKVLRVSDDLDLVALLSLRPRELTAYDRKKVSFARLFLRDFKVILIDDFCSDLGAGERRALWDELSQYLKTSGKTVIYSTTEAEEACSIANRIVVLHNGEIKQDNTAYELYNNPESVWAVEAVDENFVFDDALLTEADGKLALQLAEFALDIEQLRPRLIGKAYLGKTVLFGCHAEDMLSVDNGIETEVEFIKTLPDGSVLAKLSNGWKIKFKSLSELNSHIKNPSGLISVLPNSKKLFLFDKTSEGSILK